MNGWDADSQPAAEFVSLGNGTGDDDAKTCIPPKNIPSYKNGSVAMNINGLPYYTGANHKEAHYYDPETNSWDIGVPYDGRIYHAVVKVAEDVYWMSGN